MAVVNSLKTLLKTYPAISAALVNFGVFAAGYFGLHVTPAQLVAFAGILDALFGVIVHSNVTPVSKIPASPPIVVVHDGPVGGLPVSDYHLGGVPPSVVSVHEVPPVQTVPEAIVPLEGK